MYLINFLNELLQVNNLDTGITIKQDFEKK